MESLLNRRRTEPGHSARFSFRSGSSHDSPGRLAVVTAFVVVLIALATASTGWRYELALADSKAALHETANKHGAEQAVTAYWRERETMNEYLLSPSSSLSTESESRRREFEDSLQGLNADNASERRLVLLSLPAHAELVRRFSERRAAALQSVAAETKLTAELDAAEVGILRPLEALQTRYQADVVARQAAADRLSLEAFIAALVAATIGVTATIGLAVYARRLLRGVAQRRLADGDAAARQREFADALQNSQTGDEADDLLKRQLERTITGSSVVVLRRNNSEDRLEAVTSPSPQLALRLATAVPRSCLAVRLGRPHAEGGRDAPLLRCELCTTESGLATCQPLLVAGEVIGSTLVMHDQPLTDADVIEIASSVGQAGPVLANLRNLALAEFRAATDALTGLPNHRAVDDTLKRMVAHAARTETPMATIMLDLDHFKQINDVYGHSRGDEVLAAVGSMLAATIRTSDFAGRNGGEEFVVLLPETDSDEALEVAQKLRQAIASITIPELGRPITASLGVAAFPRDATDSSTLLRQADRLLYAAKANGRNRVETTLTHEVTVLQ